MKKELSKNYKIFIAIITILPILLIVVGFIFIFATIGDTTTKDPINAIVFFCFYLLGIIAMFGVGIFYIIDVIRSKKLSRDNKIFWIIIVIFSQFVGCGIYWYLYIWKDTYTRNIALSEEEALVFYEFLRRINKTPNNTLFNDSSEQKMSNLIERRLYDELIEIFMSDYSEMLNKSRDKVNYEIWR